MLAKEKVDIFIALIPRAECEFDESFGEQRSLRTLAIMVEINCIAK